MKRFKQYLIEQNEIKLGTYQTTALDSLTKRLGGNRQKAIDYLAGIEKRRFEHKGEIDPNWVLPSVSLKDYEEKLNIDIRPGLSGRSSNTIAVTPANVKFDKAGNIVTVNSANPDIIINAGAKPLVDNEDARKRIKSILTDISNELQPNGKYNDKKISEKDTLWHEEQHRLSRNNLFGRNASKTLEPNAGGIDYSSKMSSNNPNNSNFSLYVTSNMELPAFMSASKMNFHKLTGILLGPNMTQQELDKYKEHLKNDKDTNKESEVILHLLNDPNKGKQAEEFLRQIAQKRNIKNTGEMMA